MRKILLVGMISGALQLMHDELQTNYQMQLCVPDYKNLLGMIKIVRPEMVILFQVNQGEITRDILLGLREDWPDVPVLVICPREDKEYFRPYCPQGQFTFAFRPIKKHDILEKIEDIIASTSRGDSDDDAAANSNNVKKTVDDGSSDEDMFAAGGKKYKVLAVDDNPVILRNIRELLGNNYNIYAASSGEKAMDIMNKVDIDLVLLDYEMPGMNGIETFKLMKQQIKTYKVPVVFLTGVADRERIKEVISYQPAGYLLKPIDAKSLLETLRNILK